MRSRRIPKPDVRDALLRYSFMSISTKISNGFFHKYGRVYLDSNNDTKVGPGKPVINGAMGPTSTR